MSKNYLEENELIKKVNTYIDPIKKRAYEKVYMLSHPVLNKSPYTSDFHQNLFVNKLLKKASRISRLKSWVIYYIKNIILFTIFILQAILYKIFYRRKISVGEKVIMIDSFLLMDRVLKEKQYKELYFQNIEEVFVEKGFQTIFIPRMYGHTKKLTAVGKLFQLLQKDKRKFIFEYALLGFMDYLKIAWFVLAYPFFHFSVWQKDSSKEDRAFNNALVESLGRTGFSAYVRYLFGKNLVVKHNHIKVFSWCEFQNMEKNFYKAVNESEKDIVVNGCQFLIQYKMYQSMFIDQVDKELGITPTNVLTNGKYYSDQANQKDGVSLRYKGLFEFDQSKRDPKQSVVLLSYEVKQSREMLEKLQGIDSKLLIKIHPATSEDAYMDLIKPEWKFVRMSVYQILYQAEMVFVAPMSGTALESVALGIPVIIVADEDRYVTNPLCEVGKNQIWDIVFSKDKLLFVYNELLNYSHNNSTEVSKLAKWYKDNFFIEPTREQIIKVFELE